MKILITGAAGFLGQRLTKHLLNQNELQVTELWLIDLEFKNVDRFKEDPRVKYKSTDITKDGCLKEILPVDIVYHLAAIVSGHAEIDFDLGMSVNFDATRQLLHEIKRCSDTSSEYSKTKFIFASSLAVFGGDCDETFTENSVVKPKNSYGVQKALSELLIGEYTRKGFVDGRVLRLPTVAVRPGKPNRAASSFVSGIIREPLNGQIAICPVESNLELWIASPETVILNLVHAARITQNLFNNDVLVNLPGITVTVKDIINALGEISGWDKIKLIKFAPDPEIRTILDTWPRKFNVYKALNLGFFRDICVSDIIKQYINNEKC